MKKRMFIGIALLTAGLVSGCTIDPSVVDSPDKVHDPITIFSPVCELDDFIDEVHRSYPEINFEILNYNGQNTTAYTQEMFEAGDIPDIFGMTFNMSKHMEVSDKLIDMSGFAFTDKYKENCLNDVITESGAIYALPSHYQCQGITYNKTLLEKHGWELPQSLDDLRELSEKAQQAGVRLALNELQFSGYGFQYLCNICDTGFLSTLDGRRWQQDFLSGRASASGTPEMLECLSMLQKWRDIGMLNGDGYVINDSEQHDEYALGNTLFLLGSHNSMAGCEDEFGLMPYLSEDGKQNVYVLNVRRYYAMSRTLQQPGNEQKLKDAMHVMEVLSTVDGMNALGGDALKSSSLLPLKNAPISDDNCYYAITEEFSTGHTAPFIYSGWENAIVPVGDVMTSFILGDAELEDVVKILDASQNDIVNDITETYTTVTEHIGQEDCARLVGKAFAQATGSDLALVSLGKWIPGHISTQNTHGVSGSLYPREITEQQLCAITPTGWKDTIKTVTLTGARINELVRQGFDLYGDGKTYPYILVTKKGFSLEPDKTYKLAICGATGAVKAEGNILDSGIAGLESVEEMMSAYESFSAKDIIWE